MEQYLSDLGINAGEYKKVLGIRYDEPARYHRNKDKGNVEMPLYENKITKAMVREFWANQKFDLGLKDYEGNCDLCFMKGKKIRLTILAEKPETAKQWIEWEAQNKNGGTFDKNYSVLELLSLSKRNFEKQLDYWEQVSQPNQYKLFDDIEAVGCFCGD